MSSGAKPPVDRLALARTSGLRRQHRARFTPVVPIPPGTLVANKYCIETLLGEGGMGAVYRAEHVIMGRPIALKVMRPEMATDPSMAARFTREAQLASRIRSTNVVTIHDFGQAEDGLLYLVMELLHGEVLSAALEKRLILPWQEAASIAIQICDALEVAHRAKVVHRDLKPDNVFLCEDGTVKVLDFGIARVLPHHEHGHGDARYITHSESIVGTPLYMSPEAAGNRPIGPPADFYALGAILFEMVTGRLVFEDEQVVILLGAHLTRKPQHIREVCPDLELPEALDSLVDRLLAKDPKQRPPDAAAIAAELAAVLEAEGSKPSPISGRISLPGTKSRPSALSVAMTVPAGVTPTPEAVTPPAELTTREPTEKTRVPTMEAAAVTPRRSKWGLVAIAIAALAGVGVYAYSQGSSTPPIPEAPPPIASEAPEPEPEPSVEPAPAVEPEVQTIELSIVTTPADATITVDGTPITGGEIELPRDGAAHEVVVSAEGYTTRTVTTTADRDREIVFDLERAPRARNVRPVTRPSEPRETPREQRPRHIVGEF